jgi:hypothetical protein
MLLDLFGSRRVWIALLALVITALQTAFPQIPATLVASFQTFALALIAAFTLEDTAAALRR